MNRQNIIIDLLAIIPGAYLADLLLSNLGASDIVIRYFQIPLLAIQIGALFLMIINIIKKHR